MISFQGLLDNFKFLLIETRKQVDATIDFLKVPSSEGFDAIVSRDDYVNNLKNIIENKCFSSLHGDQPLDKADADQIRALHIISVNLERMGDFCVNIAQQVQYLSHYTVLHHYRYRNMFETVREALAHIEPAFKNKELSLALSICRIEARLDNMYKKSFDQLMAGLKEGEDAGDSVTIIFIFRYLERLGDTLLNIGEALILAILGERIKITEFQALQQTLNQAGDSLEDVDFQAILGSRSGCNVGRVGGRGKGSIFKEGNAHKIKTEKKNLDMWRDLFPGLAPQVFSYHREGDQASMLIELMAGQPLDEIILHGEPGTLRSAFDALARNIRKVWSATRKEAPHNPAFMSQLLDRIDSVRQVHPEFHRGQQQHGSFTVESSRQLIQRCAELQQELPAPLTVLIHGDFNANNIFYDADKDEIHYIDLYRSRDMDYVQDVSVFLISNFRMPVFEASPRGRINWMIDNFEAFAADLAQQWGDDTYQARMALALARSLYTSTRFELNADFAKDMFLRAQFLMEKVAGHQGKPWESFALPEDVLRY
ncbi:MAG: PhoU domain-containing protein [Desulfovibrionaceae bacterium]